MVFLLPDLYPRFGRKFPTLMLEVLRWSICHPTLYGGTDAGDAPLPMINPPDHALYAYMFSQHWETVAPNMLQPKPMEHPNRLSGLQVRPPALFREAHFWTTSKMICSMLPHAR